MAVELVRARCVRLLGALLLLAGCSGPEVLQLHTRSYQNVDGARVQDIFETQSGVRLEFVEASPGESALEALTSNRADLVLVNNSTPFTSGVRAVLPVFKSVLHVLASEELDEADALLLEDRQIYIANRSLAGANVVKLLAARQSLDPDDYEIVDNLQPGVTDLIIYFGAINPGSTSWHAAGYHLVDLGDAARSGGVEYVLPRMQPEVIPAQTYPLPGNEEPVHTIGVMTLLVTRKSVPERAVYELTRTLLEQKPRFTSVAPTLFAAVTDKFDPLDLNFPLHNGARRYLARDEPSLLERYAETINMLVYVCFLLLTGSVAAVRWRAHKKRDRIDRFYLRALLLQKQVTDHNQAELLVELQALEEEAFAVLIDGKLAADDSFRIFTDLVARTRSDLQSDRV